MRSILAFYKAKLVIKYIINVDVYTVVVVVVVAAAAAAAAGVQDIADSET